MRTSAILAALCVAIALRAQPGPGESRSFGLQGSPVYDVSGSRYDSDGIVEIYTQVAHLANGQLAGTGEAYYYDGFVELEATGALRGRVASVGVARRLTVGFRAPITGSDDDGNTYSGNYVLNGTALLDATTSGEFVGSARSRYCVQGQDCGTGRGSIGFDPGNGDVVLTFTNMQVTGTAVTGEALIQVGGSIQTFTYTITGKYIAAKFTYALLITGHGTGAGSGFSAKCSDTAPQGFTLEKLTGRLLGQTVRYKRP